MRATYRMGYAGAMTHNPLWFGLIALFACHTSAGDAGANTTRWTCAEAECVCDDGTACTDSENCAQVCAEE